MNRTAGDQDTHLSNTSDRLVQWVYPWGFRRSRAGFRISFGKCVVGAVFLTLAVQVSTAWAQTPNPYERIRQQTEERLRQMRADQEAANQRARERQAELRAEAIARAQRAAQDQEKVNQIAREAAAAIEQGRRDSEQRLRDYNARQEMNRQKADDAVATMTSSSSTNTVEGHSPPSSTGVSMLSGSGSSDDAYSGEKFPETRLRVIQDEEASSMSYSQLRYAIKEVCARHGADFSGNEEFRKQFSQFDWYTPREGASIEEIRASLTDLERANMKTLRKYYDLKKGQ